MRSPIIDIQNLSLTYGNTVILSDINLCLLAGFVVSLMGTSGIGKSSLLRVLMGLEPQGRGNLKLPDANYALSNWKNKPRLFSIVPQVPHLFPWKTVFENVAIAISEPLSPKDKHHRVMDMLETVQLSHAAKKYPNEISLGMASRVSFARAFMIDAPCLLLDEPFAALDAHTRRELQIWLGNAILKLKVPALLVTHDAREALLLSREVFLLQGRPARIGKRFSSPLYAHLNHSNLSQEATQLEAAQTSIGPFEEAILKDLYLLENEIMASLSEPAHQV